jgi:hypothetical protein
MNNESSKTPQISLVRVLDLNAEKEQVAGEVLAVSVAVEVYRQLRSVREASDELMGSCRIIGNCSGGPGCDIIGNCSSSSRTM